MASIQPAPPVRPVCFLPLPVSSSEQESPLTQRIRLEAEEIRALRELLNAPFTYKATASGVPLDFEFSSLVFFADLLEGLEKNGLSVKGVYLKGSAIRSIIDDPSIEFADLDISFELKRPEDLSQINWEKIETLFYEALAKAGGISGKDGEGQWIFPQGGLKGRFLHKREDRLGRVSTFSLPTSQRGKERDIDVEFAIENSRIYSCFSSYDAEQIDIYPLLSRKQEIHPEELWARTVDEFSIDETRRHRRANQFSLTTKRSSKLRGALFRYLLYLTKGRKPADDNQILIKRGLYTGLQEEWQKQKERQKIPSKEFTFKAFLALQLQNFFTRHCPNKKKFQVIFLLNCDDLIATSTLKDKAPLRQVIAELLFEVIGAPLSEKEKLNQKRVLRQLYTCRTYLCLLNQYKAFEEGCLHVEFSLQEAEKTLSSKSSSSLIREKLFALFPAQSCEKLAAKVALLKPPITKTESEKKEEKSSLIQKPVSARIIPLATFRDRFAFFKSVYAQGKETPIALSQRLIALLSSDRERHLDEEENEQIQSLFMPLFHNLITNPKSLKDLKMAFDLFCALKKEEGFFRPDQLPMHSEQLLHRVLLQKEGLELACQIYKEICSIEGIPPQFLVRLTQLLLSSRLVQTSNEGFGRALKRVTFTWETHFQVFLEGEILEKLLQIADNTKNEEMLQGALAKLCKDPDSTLQMAKKMAQIHPAEGLSFYAKKENEILAYPAERFVEMLTVIIPLMNMDSQEQERLASRVVSRLMQENLINETTRGLLQHVVKNLPRPKEESSLVTQLISLSLLEKKEPKVKPRPKPSDPEIVLTGAQLKQAQFLIESGEAFRSFKEIQLCLSYLSSLDLEKRETWEYYSRNCSTCIKIVTFFETVKNKSLLQGYIDFHSAWLTKERERITPYRDKFSRARSGNHLFCVYQTLLLNQQIDVPFYTRKREEISASLTLFQQSLEKDLLAPAGILELWERLLSTLLTMEYPVEKITEIYNSFKPLIKPPIFLYMGRLLFTQMNQHFQKTGSIDSFKAMVSYFERLISEQLSPFDITLLYDQAANLILSDKFYFAKNGIDSSYRQILLKLCCLLISSNEGERWIRAPSSQNFASALARAIIRITEAMRLLRVKEEEPVLKQLTEDARRLQKDVEEKKSSHNVEEDSVLLDQYLEKKNFEAALTLALKLSTQLNSALPYAALIGRCYRELHDNYESMTFLQQALVMIPNDLKILEELATTYAALDPVQEINFLLRWEEQLGSNSKPQAWHRLAVAYLKIDDVHEALVWLHKAEARDPRNKETIELLANIYEKYFLPPIYPKALEYLYKKSELSPKDPETHFAIANLYTRLNNFPEARLAYERGFELAIADDEGADDAFLYDMEQVYKNLGEEQAWKVYRARAAAAWPGVFDD